MAKTSIDIKVDIEDIVVDRNTMEVWIKMSIGNWDRVIHRIPPDFELLEQFIEPGNIIQHTGSKVEWEIETISRDTDTWGNGFSNYNGSRVYTIKSLNSGRRKRIFTRNLSRDFDIIKAKPGFQVLYRNNK